MDYLVGVDDPHLAAEVAYDHAALHRCADVERVAPRLLLELDEQESLIDRSQRPDGVLLKHARQTILSCLIACSSKSA